MLLQEIQDQMALRFDTTRVDSTTLIIDCAGNDFKFVKARNVLEATLNGLKSDLEEIVDQTGVYLTITVDLGFQRLIIKENSS